MRILRIFLALFLLLTLCAAASSAAVDKVPSFTLESATDGKDVSSEEFKGKVLLVTFFATWCPPCRQEIPTFIELQDEYGAKGFSVIGLSVDEKGPKVVVKLINKTKINYPVLMADGKVARDFGGIAGIPTSFLVDREGNIVKRFPGYIPKSLLVKEIKPLL